MPAQRIFLLLLLALGAAAIGPSPTSASSAAPSHVLTFTDPRNGLRLTIESNPAARDAGMLAFFVPGLGTYMSVTPATLSVVSPHSTNVTFSGTTELVAEDGTMTRSATRLQAHLDPVNHIAEATLTTERDRYHLVVTATSRAGLQEVLREFESAMRTGDHEALYGISSSEYTGSFSVQEFVAAASAQTAALGPVTDLRRLRIGDTQNTGLGVTFVVVPYEVIRETNGVTRTVTEDLYLVHEGALWRIWFGVER